MSCPRLVRRETKRHIAKIGTTKYIRHINGYIYKAIIKLLDSFSFTYNYTIYIYTIDIASRGTYIITSIRSIVLFDFVTHCITFSHFVFLLQEKTQKWAAGGHHFLLVWFVPTDVRKPRKPMRSAVACFIPENLKSVKSSVLVCLFWCLVCNNFGDLIIKRFSHFGT